MDHTVTSHSRIAFLYQKVRKQTEILCEPLEIEDFVVQPIVDVSPLKWHLGHTTWFFETFILAPNYKGYQVFNEKFSFLFNSYYISAGKRWTRANRGQLTRPTVHEIFQYRRYIDEKMENFLADITPTTELSALIELGCNHEQQHQELFLYDIKRILGDNPIFPLYVKLNVESSPLPLEQEWLAVSEGVYEIGFEGDDFHFDNEEKKHKVFLHSYEISSKLVSNNEYMEFIEDGGYQNHLLWLSEAWEWINENTIKAPRYWHEEDGGEWWNYTLGGYRKVNEDDPLAHVSYYEADAFARWKGCKLPTEFEWEVACGQYSKEIPFRSNFVEDQKFQPVQTDSYDFYGNLWEWTSSAYAPYPYFKIAEGALGEYNGKFMVNQMVLRGGSYGTSRNHIRKTYRNFFHPHLRWLFSGIRLAKFK
ncbi:MAG: ergothioneine biosynthesis protein EgtB [Bacteroidota bacterium]